MKNKALALKFFPVAFAVCLCLFMIMPVNTYAAMEKPVISLESFEVPQYDGFWYYSKGAQPTKGDPGDRGAPLPLSFLFSIKNPNSYPVLLDSIKFGVAFDGFSLITVNTQDYVWIPAKKTTQLRITSMITVRSALLSLSVTGGFELEKKGMDKWDALERWWKGVPDLSVPVEVTQGAAVFNDGKGQTEVVPFKMTFP